MSGEAPAIVTAAEVITHAALRERVVTAAGRLRALGVGAGTRVGLWAENGPDWIVLALAVTRVAGVLIPLNTRLADPEIDWQIKRAGMPLVIAGNGLAHRRPNGCRVFSLDEWHSLPVASGAPDPVCDDAGREHAIVFTSGTSGRPKGAILTWGNQLASVRAAAGVLPLGPTDRWLASLPFFHVGGMGIVFRCVLARACIVIPDSFAAAELDDRLEADAITHVSLVEVTLRRILELRGGRAFPPQLRAAVVGGGPVAPALVERCPPALPSYGMTETCSMVTLVRPGTPITQRLDSGKPLPGVDLRIADDGIIEVRGPMVMRGYLDDPQATAAAIRDGWFRTGDLGEIDAGGNLRVHARREDLIVSGGENIYPAEIERALREHPDVLDAVVLGVPDERWGEAPLAFVELRQPGSPDLRAFLSARLAGFKLPRIALVVAIPRLANGKPDRMSLRSRAV